MNFEKAVTGLGEECGVFGAYDMDGRDVAAVHLLRPFCAAAPGTGKLRHCSDGYCTEREEVLSRKGLGHVNDVFDEESTWQI